MTSPQNVNLLLGLVAIVAVSSTLLSMLCLLWVTRRRRKLADHTPPVTIYKPLKGLDEELEENLRSFFGLDYPTYQLLFCVADADDPAIGVVQKLLAEFPGHDAQLVVGCPAFGLNPKVESLASMERYRKHDVILISDSNVRVQPSYLRETACLPGRAGRRAGDEPVRGRGRDALRRDHGKPPAQRVHRRRHGDGVGAAGHLRRGQVDDDAGSRAGGDRRVRPRCATCWPKTR